MADLEQVIADSIADASGDNGTDTSVDTSTDTGETVVADATLPDVDTPADADTSADPDADTTVVEDKVDPNKTDDRSEAEKILDAAGVKAPKEGERENRIPYSRTVKIVGNALKKQTEAHTKAVGDLNTKVTAQEGELKQFRAADDLAVKDPDRYMQLLASINPAFKAYVKNGAATTTKTGTTTPAAGASKLGPKPGPDIKYADGSLAFSPEQLEKREEWLIANAVEKATTDAEARAEAKYGPLAKQFDETQATHAQRERIQGVIRTEMEHWGDDFPKPGSAEEKAVDKMLKDNPKMPLRTAIHKVVVGNLKVAKGKQKDELLTEINGRKAAASAPPATRKAALDPNVVRSTEDVIRESIAAAGLK